MVGNVVERVGLRKTCQVGDLKQLLSTGVRKSFLGAGHDCRVWQEEVPGWGVEREGHQLRVSVVT